MGPGLQSAASVRNRAAQVPGHPPWFPAAALTRDIPVVSRDIMSHRHGHQPLLLDSDMAFSVSSDWNLTIDPGGGAGHGVPSSISLYNAQAAPLLLLSHLITTCSYMVVASTEG